MLHFPQLMSLVRREAERTMRKFHKPARHGFVSSYDPKVHKVKVTFQPTGAESGWLPLTALAVGNKFGHLSAPKIGDQVKVEYQEGEHDVGRVTTRLFNKPNPPPQIQSGEYAKIHETGSGHYHKQDGTVQYAGPQFFQVGQDQPGQSGHTETGGSSSSTQQQQQQQQNQKAGKQNFQYNPDGSTVFNMPDQNAGGTGNPTNPTYTATIQKDINHTSTQGNRNVTANQGAINHTSKTIVHNASTTITNTAGTTHSTTANEQISDSAPEISHNGNTNVAGNFGVTGGGISSAGDMVSSLGNISSTSGNISAPLGQLSSKTLSVGTGTFTVDATGHFATDAGGAVTGGLTTDTLTVTLTSTFEGKLTITAGGMSVTGGLITDTLKTNTAATSVPVKITTNTYAVGPNDSSLINDVSGGLTLTLPTPSSFPGRWLYITNAIGGSNVNSASSNVVPPGSTNPGTGILSSNSGHWAALQSDGTNWVIMMGVT